MIGLPVFRLISHTINFAYMKCTQKSRKKETNPRKIHYENEKNLQR